MYNLAYDSKCLVYFGYKCLIVVICLCDGHRYACSKSGHIFEVDYRKVAVRHVRRLHAVSDAVRSTHGIGEKQPATISNGKPHCTP